MAGNSIGQIFTVTTCGESHGAGLLAIVDGVPPGLALSEADLQIDLDRRKPGTSKYSTQRRESDEVEIISGVFEGKTTGTSIGLLIRNTNQKSKDYGEIKDTFRPGHADYTYSMKYGFRDYRGGGRSSARETAMRVAAGQDGLDLVHRILFEAPDYLSPEGLLVCEVGDSEWALKQAYPEIQFDWLRFAHGGHGIFAITYDELMSYRSLFANYVQLLDSNQ